MLGNLAEFLGKVEVLYLKLCLLIDLLRVPIVVKGVKEPEFLGGSVKVKPLGYGLPDLDQMTKLAKSPKIKLTVQSKLH